MDKVKEGLNSFTRENTISWMENNQLHGSFNGHPEESMDFTKLSDEELEWYFYNWAYNDICHND